LIAADKKRGIQTRWVDVKVSGPAHRVGDYLKADPAGFAFRNTLVQAYFEIAIGSMDENQSSHSLVAIVSRVHGAERVESTYLSR
jgi:hypothetical protein